MCFTMRNIEDIEYFFLIGEKSVWIKVNGIIFISKKREDNDNKSFQMMVDGYLFPDIESIPKKIALKFEYSKIKLEWTSQESNTTFC